MARLPLFPLSTVLFPGGLLPLRLFEPRYISMAGHCLRDDTHFGVVLIRAGSETETRTIYQVGCAARVIDWYQNDDGLLGITALGERRFQVRNSATQDDGLLMGEVDWLEEEGDAPIGEAHEAAVATLQAAIDSAGDWYAQIEQDFGSASWVGARLTEILPLANEHKQACLEMEDPLARLDILQPVLGAVLMGTRGDNKLQ